MDDLHNGLLTKLHRLKIELANAARHCDAFEHRVAEILEDPKVPAENRFASSIANAMARARQTDDGSQSSNAL